MAKVGWTDPNKPWAQHSRPLARVALNDARKAGWWLKKASGSAKVWGIITCGDPTLPGSERCSTSILSTSGSPDGSETAEYINKAVSSCTHDRAPTSEVDALANAQRLVAAASRCLDAAHAQSEAAATEADDVLDQALAQEDLAAAAEVVASDAAVVAGTSTSIGPAGLAERARDQASEAKGLVADDTSRAARMLKDQCDDIRNTARTLLSQLR